MGIICAVFEGVNPKTRSLFVDVLSFGAGAGDGAFDPVRLMKQQGFGVEKWLDSPGDGRKIAKTTHC